MADAEAYIAGLADAARIVEEFDPRAEPEQPGFSHFSPTGHWDWAPTNPQLEYDDLQEVTPCTFRAWAMKNPRAAIAFKIRHRAADVRENPNKWGPPCAAR